MSKVKWRVRVYIYIYTYSVTPVKALLGVGLAYRRKIQTHKRLKSMLFIRTKHHLQIVGVIPLIKLQNDNVKITPQICRLCFVLK